MNPQLIQHVIETVAAQHGIDPLVLFQLHRYRNHVHCRWEIFHQLHHHHAYHPAQIATIFRLHRCAVIYGLRQLTNHRHGPIPKPHRRTKTPSPKTRQPHPPQQTSPNNKPSPRHPHPRQMAHPKRSVRSVQPVR